jgi:serine protease Do
MRWHLTVAAAVLASTPWLLSCPVTAAEAASFHPRRTPVVDVVKRVRAAVVNIQSERTVQGQAEGEPSALTTPNRVNGMGTGIIIDPRGYIITNHHVVEEVSVLRVRLADGASATARVIARDNENDLAMLKIDVGRPLPTIPLGTARDLMVGETVVAIGNAYGYEHTVTVGIISALKRDVVLNKDISYKSLIQTDASINPGNSGGPLLNIHGDLIGVNVAIRAGAQGIGFAIPVDTMLRVAADMLSTRKRSGTWHGLVGRDETVAGEPEKGTPAVLVRQLVVERAESGSPAVKAGVQPGDAVLKVNDQPVASVLDVERALLECRTGDRVPVVVRRKNGEQRLEMVLAPADRAGAAGVEVVWRKLGVRLQPVAPELVTRVHAQLRGGMAVTEVRPDGAAARAGIHRGDILVGLHQWEMLSLDNVVFVLNHNDLSSFLPLRFYTIRSGQVYRGWLAQID